MRKPESYLKSVMTDERHSCRKQCDVEIFEREVVTRVRMSNQPDTARSLPRLVVTDAINATRDFVSKRRSEFRELDNFLKSISPRRPLHSK